MTTDHACEYCGRPVTPCANCGSTEGHMIRASNHSDMWIHEQQVDCIVHLQSDLKKAHAQLGSAVVMSIGGILYRVLPEPVGYSGTAETEAPTP